MLAIRLINVYPGDNTIILQPGEKIVGCQPFFMTIPTIIIQKSGITLDLYATTVRVYVYDHYSSVPSIPHAEYIGNAMKVEVQVTTKLKEDYSGSGKIIAESLSSLTIPQYYSIYVINEESDE